VRVAFKLDPALTRGAYLGDRWVSPPVFQAAAQTGSTFRVDARVERAPAGPAEDATWTAGDGDAVAVAPAQGRQVEIAVSRPGRSTLTVVAGGDATVLTVDAVHAEGRWFVTFSE
jgi:hypothetical protein